MKSDILFAEKQRFNQWWIWLILLGINAFMLYGVSIQVIGGRQFGTKPSSDTVLIMTAGFCVLLIPLFISLHLDTLIKDDGIYIRFFPFHLSFRHYSWDKITKSFVRQYNPIVEYGGWGFRLGFFGRGKAFNVSGNKGLQLEFLDHKKLLIGTNKPDELNTTLKKLGYLKS